MQRILCVVDFSESSPHALRYAARLAEHHGCRVTAVHVLPFTVSVAAGLEGALPSPYVYTAQDVANARERLRLLTESLICAQPIDLVVTQGVVVDAILDMARSLEAGFVVLGTHGRGGISRFVLGSIAERVLARSTVPVITVPPGASDPPSGDGPLFGRVVCATDFSPASLAAVGMAVRLARDYQATLTVTHAVEPVPAFEPVFPVVLGSLPFDEVAARAADERARALLPADLLDAGRGHVVVGRGKAHREILRVAQEARADLIVMGAHASAAGDLGFGSTTNHVIREAACPVLSVRGEPHR